MNDDILHKMLIANNIAVITWVLIPWEAYGLCMPYEKLMTRTNHTIPTECSNANVYYYEVTSSWEPRGLWCAMSGDYHNPLQSLKTDEPEL